MPTPAKVDEWELSSASKDYSYRVVEYDDVSTVATKGLTYGPSAGTLGKCICDYRLFKSECKAKQDEWAHKPKYKPTAVQVTSKKKNHGARREWTFRAFSENVPVVLFGLYLKLEGRRREVPQGRNKAAPEPSQRTPAAQNLQGPFLIQPFNDAGQPKQNLQSPLPTHSNFTCPFCSPGLVV